MRIDGYDNAIEAQIGGQLFGLPISRVQDVFMPQRLTRVPRGFAKDDPAAEYLKDVLEKEGIPHLCLEFEEKMWIFDKARTEVETFVESMLFD